MTMYKYIASDRLDILRNLLIRFTQPTALNDPFEFRPLVSGFRRPDVAAKDLAEELERQLPAEISKYQAVMNATDRALFPQLANQLKPAMVAQAMELIEEVFPTLKESLFAKLGGALGILSLTEDPNSLLMWAHYASNHTGFVLVFDESHPWFSAKVAPTDEFHHLQKVSYLDQPTSPYLSELSGRDVFYSKLKQWEYEREWRIIRPLTEASRQIGDEVYLFDVPAQSLRGVILGIRTTATARAELSAILSADSKLSHIRKFQARISPGTNTIEVLPDD